MLTIVDWHSDVAEDVILFALWEITMQGKIVMLCHMYQAAWILSIHWAGLGFCTIQTLEIRLYFHILRYAFGCPAWVRCSCCRYLALNLIEIPWERLETHSSSRLKASGYLTNHFVGVLLHLHGWVACTVPHTWGLHLMSQPIRIVVELDWLTLFKLFLLEKVLVVFCGELL